LLKQTGVGAVQVYPIWNGPGTVLCSVVDSDYLPVSVEKVAELQMILCPPDDGSSVPSDNGYGMAPIGAIATVTTATAVNISITANARLKAGSSATIAEVQAEAERQIREYILDLCSDWGTMGSWRSAEYSTIIYINKVLGIINSIPGVLVANNVKINGEATDLILTEKGTIGGQQVPVFNSVVIIQI
jgi:uncharacterized phage protein gp47/JayE